MDKRLIVENTPTMSIGFTPTGAIARITIPASEGTIEREEFEVYTDLERFVDRIRLLWQGNHRVIAVSDTGAGAILVQPEKQKRKKSQKTLDK